MSTSMFAINTAYRLWKYAVIVSDTEGNLSVKDGDTRCETREEAIDYATSQTTGKARGLVLESDLLGVWDMTDDAIRRDPQYDPTLTDEQVRKGYDNAIRSLMPLKRVRKVNFRGQQSLEVHPIPKELLDNPNWRANLAYEWNLAHQNILFGSKTVTLKKYTARQYLVESFDKTSKNINKFLLAAATGAGKETSTLALLIHLHDVKKYDNKKLNIAVATIPSTISELMNELATVCGMDVSNYGFVDYSRIAVYVTKQWYEGYKKDCSPAAMHMINTRAKIVNSVSDIPKTHADGVVPVLFGSYHDLAQKSDKINSRYDGLAKRIGTLSIGEAHQMLSNADNKMWKTLDSVFGKKSFKLFITGTPYSFIYGSAAAEFFDVPERSLFTRNDMYRDKRTNANSDFKDYPDFNYYGIDVAEIVSKLKTDPNWKDDANGFTWVKFFSYDATNNKFLYEKSILWLFKRMFGSSAFDENGDPLSIYNAKGLCEKAKQHILVALPIGKEGTSAQVYIKALKTLLEKHGIFEGDVFDTYSDDLGDRKADIAAAAGRTLTLTCNKDCTGANIPELGSLVFLRNIGNSINFFEQATGRIGRKYVDKTNCGVFLGDLEAAMNLTVVIEEIISLERGEDYSSKEIIQSMLDNYNFFTSRNGKWAQIDIPEFSSILEELNARGHYGLNQCNIFTSAEDGFELFFNNKTSSESKRVDITSNGNDGAKNYNNQAFEQLGLPFEKNKSPDENWNNMKRLFIAKCRYLAFIYNIQTVAQCVALVEQAIAEKNTTITKIIGKGVEYFPQVMQDGQIDVRLTNRWIQKFNDHRNNIEFVFDEFMDEIYRTKEQFVAESNNLLRSMAENVLDAISDRTTVKILDPSGGRGGFLVYLLKVAKEKNIAIEPSMLYYNDIDPTAVEFFRSVNRNYNLGIPDENITCEDFLTKEYPMKFDVIVGNPPFNTAMEEAGVSGTIGNNTLYRQFIKKSFEVADIVAMVSHKGAIKLFENFDKQIDTVNMMTEFDYWKYDTLYFIGRSIPKESNYVVVDKIISKIWGNNEFGLTRQSDSLMQNRRNGTVVDGDSVIVKLNGEEPMQYGNVTKPEKIVYGPKFAFTILESQPSYTVTDEPMYASCVCILKTETLDDANRMMLFVKNNRGFRYFVKKMKTKGHAIGINRLKKFDLSQIVTGFEYPSEWNLTAEEIYEIENS